MVPQTKNQMRRSSERMDHEWLTPKRYTQKHKQQLSYGHTENQRCSLKFHFHSQTEASKQIGKPGSQKANELVPKSGRVQQQFPSPTGYRNQMQNKLACSIEGKPKLRGEYVPGVHTGATYPQVAHFPQGKQPRWIGENSLPAQAGATHPATPNVDHSSRHFSAPTASCHGRLAPVGDSPFEIPRVKWALEASAGFGKGLTQARVGLPWTRTPRLASPKLLTQVRVPDTQ